MTCFDLYRTFADYYEKATFLREKYGDQIHILIGFELDYIRPSSIPLIQTLQKDYKFDLFVGSVHHVNTIPIDFDKEKYLEAKASCGGSEERLFEAYFDAQYEMLTQLSPPIVGHFDLIRLLSDEPTRPLQPWKGVWERVIRNVEFVVSYGGIVELNSSSLRKGWETPYPQRDVAEVRITIPYLTS